MGLRLSLLGGTVPTLTAGVTYWVSAEQGRDAAGATPSAAPYWQARSTRVDMYVQGATSGGVALASACGNTGYPPEVRRCGGGGGGCGRPRGGMWAPSVGAHPAATYYIPIVTLPLYSRAPAPRSSRSTCR
jgi:hypothetical protein